MKTTLTTLLKRRKNGEKLVMLTAYDAIMSRISGAAGIDFLLVGDSVGMTQLGYANTLPVTMEEMLSHCAAVRRGAPDSFVVFDMPFMSYQESVSQALHNAGLAMKQAGADAVKLEGGAEYASLVRQMVHSGIPVMGHIGLMPQHVQVAGGYKVVGRNDDSAARVRDDALKLQEAGCFAIVLECVPAALAAQITAELTIPTIGIGAGNGCSGQVQVTYDLLGLLPFMPKHAKKYADAGEVITQALAAYAQEVKTGVFPAQENSF